MTDPVKAHKLSESMLALLNAFAVAGHYDSWALKHTAIPVLRELGHKVSIQTVKALEARGLVESKVRDNDGTPGSLTEYHLSATGREIAQVMWADAVATGDAIRETEDVKRAAFDNGVFLDQLIMTAGGVAVTVTAIDRFGVTVTGMDSGNHHFATVAELIDWSTGDLDRKTVMDCVTMDAMTLGEAIAYAVRLRAEVEHANKVEDALNAAFLAKISDDPSVEMVGGQPFGRASGLPIFRNSADTTPGILERHAMKHQAIAEDADTIPAPFRTTGKVKSTTKSRRYRKG